MANAHKIAAFAERLEKLTADFKSDLDTLKEQAEKADIDFAGIRRLVSWQRKDATKRAEQEAIDHQYRFLAGDVDEPASIPRSGELATAIQLFGEHKSIRQVADTLKISVGKAHKLKTLAALFTVHLEMNVNTNDPETGEINETGRTDRSGPRSEGDDAAGIGEPVRRVECVPVADRDGEGEGPELSDGGGDSRSAESVIGAAGDDCEAVHGHVSAPEVAQDTRTFDEIVGERPAFLQRPQATA